MHFLQDLTTFCQMVALSREIQQGSCKIRKEVARRYILPSTREPSGCSFFKLTPWEKKGRSTSLSKNYERTSLFDTAESYMLNL